MKALFLFLLSFSVMAESPVVTPSIRVNYESKEDLKSDLKKVLDEKSVSDIFDRVDNMKVEVMLLNDYNFTDPNSPEIEKLNDDIGRTHGLRMTVYKNIAPLVDGSDKYFVSFSYESNLHTNIPDDVPRPIDFYSIGYENERGFWQVDVYFKEENILRMMVGKMKTGNAMYYQAGVGYQEINSEDNSRGFLLSSVAQQAWLHKGVNDVFGRKFREYNYLQSGRNQRSMTLEGEVGYDKTLYQTKNSRSFMRTGVDARLSGIDGASFVGTYIQFGQDYDPSGYLPAVRVAGGIHYKRFANEEYKEASLEAALAGEHAALKFRYVLPFDHDPSYLNVLPMEFEHRIDQRPDKEPLIELILEGRL